jgi:hypothetical protein
MRSTFNRVWMVLAAGIALLFGGAAIASATPASPAPAHVEIAQSAASANAVGWTFNNGQTKWIYAAAVNADSLTSICKSIVPGPANILCEGIKFAAVPIRNLGRPGDHDCLHAFAQVGWPPVGVYYVHC